MPVKPDGELAEARFIERPNRFIVIAELEGDEGVRVRAHCPNPGRLSEFLHVGNPLRLRRRPDATPDQATEWSLVAALDGRFHVNSELAAGEPPAQGLDWTQGAWVMVDTQMTNRLVLDALETGTLATLGQVQAYATEPAMGSSRFDFQLETPTGDVLVEAKSVSLIHEDGRTGLFPDAPTTRGVRHLRELAELASQGRRASLLFVGVREDIEQIRAYRERDPAFAQALLEASQAGVEIIAHRMVTENGAYSLGPRIPVILPTPG